MTHLLAAEDGPGAVVARLRGRLGTGWTGELADCFQCLSLWVAVPMTAFVTRDRRDFAGTWLALSAGACVIEELLGPRASDGTEPFFGSSEEVEDGLLWAAAGGRGGESSEIDD